MQLIHLRTFITVSSCELEDVTYHAVIAELHALDDHTVTNVQAGNYAFCWNALISASVISPSRSARPVMATGSPISRSSYRSSMPRTRPDACNWGEW